MNKETVALAVSAKLGVSRVVALNVVDAVLDSVHGGLVRGETVTLSNFGTFQVRDRAARTGRNPATGEPLELPPSRVVTFKSGAGLKRALKQAPAG